MYLPIFAGKKYIHTFYLNTERSLKKLKLNFSKSHISHTLTFIFQVETIFISQKLISDNNTVIPDGTSSLQFSRALQKIVCENGVDLAQLECVKILRKNFTVVQLRFAKLGCMKLSPESRAKRKL